ncbi:MAG: hypothetical protein IJ003_05595 [Candidatus Gastranaerophilales bacterium]|nr:hypothetical protein [Candidatus Gastranaerophilales bacterium]
MKKMLSSLIVCAISFGIIGCHKAYAAYNVVPKAPYISPSLKPIIQKYRQENYVGAMIDLEELVKKEKNNTYAKYYLALCYTQLGYKEEAQIVYTEVIMKDDNLALTHYSKRALTCLNDPTNTICQPIKPEPEDVMANDDMSNFIRSGKKIHPAAMDRITRERMERRLQAAEYQRKQQEAQNPQDGQKQAMTPTNEEIASALNTLSKIGMNPYTQPQTYNLANLNSINPMNFNQNNILPMMLQNNTNPEVAKMFLYNQMNQQQNNLLNYGI